MKYKKILVLQTIALAAGFAATASTGSAAGQLGQRYLEATIDGVYWDNGAGIDDGLGGTIIYNQPLAASFDLGLGYSHQSSDLATGGSLDGDAFFFTGTWFKPAANGKIYARAGLGWLEASVPTLTDNTWAWKLETGLEMALGKRLTVTPYISYTDGFEGGWDGTFDFGAAGAFDVTSRMSLLLDVSITEDSDWGVRGGVVFRF